MLDAETALVEYLGVQAYVSTLAYLCEDCEPTTKPRTTGRRETRDGQGEA